MFKNSNVHYDIYFGKFKSTSIINIIIYFHILQKTLFSSCVSEIIDVWACLPREMRLY